MKKLFALLLILASTLSQAGEWTGTISGELAFATMQEKTKVPRSQCTTCNGSGKVKGGDGVTIVWRECTDCIPPSGDAQVGDVHYPVRLIRAKGDEGGWYLASAVALDVNRLETAAHVFDNAPNSKKLLTNLEIEVMSGDTWVPAKLVTHDFEIDRATIEAPNDVVPVTRKPSIGEEVVVKGMNSELVGTIDSPDTVKFPGTQSVVQGDSGGGVFAVSDGALVGIIQAFDTEIAGLCYFGAMSDPEQPMATDKRYEVVGASWCGPCIQFKTNELPKLEADGWVIEQRDAGENDGGIPAFIVYRGESKISEWHGYLTAEQAAIFFKADPVADGKYTDLRYHMAIDHKLPWEQVYKCEPDELRAWHDRLAAGNR